MKATAGNVAQRRAAAWISETKVWRGLSSLSRHSRCDAQKEGDDDFFVIGDPVGGEFLGQRWGRRFCGLYTGRAPIRARCGYGSSQPISSTCPSAPEGIN